MDRGNSINWSRLAGQRNLSINTSSTRFYQLLNRLRRSFWTASSEGKNNPTVKISTPEVEVVLERMFEIKFAANEELMELIQWMKCHLSHRFPKGASFLEIFKYALSYVKDREDLSNYSQSRESSAKSDSRYISKATKQKVWKRDEGKCTFVGANNKRCNTSYYLQFDHHPVPYARGGPSTANNLRLLCAKHNRHTAEKAYGELAVKKHYIKEASMVYLTPNRRSPAARSKVRPMIAGIRTRMVQRSRAGPIKGPLSTAIRAYN
jgi:5-methylcytosine-specific restriction endonuclease McrA